MRQLKTFALTALAVVGLLAFFGGATASAATDTSPAGTKYTGERKATATSSLLLKAGFANITCTESTIAGTTSISTMSFSGCGSATVDVLNKGSGMTKVVVSEETKTTIEVKETQVTVSSVGVSCVYGGGAGTEVGVLTESKGTGGTAKGDVTASLPKISGGILCASPATFSGSYVITTPDYLDVD